MTKRILKQGIYTLAIIIATSFALVGCSDVKDTAILNILKISATRVNAECPQIINNTTTLISCEAVPPKTLEFYYAMKLVKAGQFTTEEFRRMNESGVLYYVQTEDSFKQLRDSEVRLVYIYKDDDGQEIGRVTLDADDYKKPIVESAKDMSGAADVDIIHTLEKAMDGMRKTLPIKFDETTSVVDCRLNGKTIEYIYSLNLRAENIPDTTKFKSSNKETLSLSVSQKPESIEIFGAGIIYKYIFYDKYDEYICSLEIAIDDIIKLKN